MNVGFTGLLVVCIFAGAQLAVLPTGSGCPGGLGHVYCFVDPCSTSPGCHGYPDAQCVSNYCGGCNAEWYAANGKLVLCH